MCFGVGAAAVVSNTSTTGRITEVRMLPSKITGTANVTSVSNVMVHGTGTAFNTELVPGDSIMIGFDTRKVVSIASATSLNVDSYFSDIYINKPIRKPGKDLLGGQGYKQEKLPTISDHSAHQFPLELNGVKKCVMKFNNYIRIKTPPVVRIFFIIAKYFLNFLSFRNIM
jgi:hypothetical protein